MIGPPQQKGGRAFFRDSVPLPTRKTLAEAEGGSKKPRFYKPLSKEFRRDGFNYRLIAREGHGAIYERTWDGCADPARCYEVIRIQRREGFEINSRFVGPAEVYPKSEAWGVDGFTLTDKDAAFAKLSAMRAISITEPCSLRRDGWKSKKGNTEWKTPKTH
jgi:hypothetical protein